MTTFSLSPSVDYQEQDQTGYIPPVGTSAGAFSGSFQWGPVMYPVNVQSPTQLKTVFYQPNDNTAVSYFSAENFLQYSANLNVVRTVGLLAKNATAAGVGQLIQNLDDYTANFSTGVGSYGGFAAKYAGALGNGLFVSICDSTNFSKPLAGTITTAIGSDAVTGVGTTFTSQLVVGDILTTSTGAIIGTVETVSSDTAAVLVSSANMAVVAGSAIAKWQFYSLFATAPSTTAYTAALGGSLDEIHVVVQDTNGYFSSAPGTILETYPYLSVASDAISSNGSNAYYKTVINGASKYVWWMKHPTAGANWGGLAQGTAFATLTHPENSTMSGGVSDDILTDAMGVAGYSLFANANEIDVNLIITGGASPTVSNSVISNVAMVRLDCIPFISPQLSDVYNNAGSEAQAIIATRSLFPSTDRGFMDSGWKYQFDRYNGVYRWIPLNGDTAGLAAQCDATNAVWYSFAGYNRGQYKNVTKLAYNPSKTDRDMLFPMNINPVITEKGQGTILLGDKTLLARPSDFDAINVRRLFDFIEKAIATASKYKLFEFNNPSTRSSWLSAINAFMRTVQGGNGVVAFKAYCDGTNNGPDVINVKGFVGQLSVQPSLAIRNISLTFVAVPAGVSFTEIVG
jgi:hypothetical protein